MMEKSLCLGSTIDDGKGEMPLRETAQEEAGTVLDRSRRSPG